MKMVETPAVFFCSGQQCDGLEAASDFEFSEGVSQVALDCIDADEKISGDLFVQMPTGAGIEDLPFSFA